MAEIEIIHIKWNETGEDFIERIYKNYKVIQIVHFWQVSEAVMYAIVEKTQ